MRALHLLIILACVIETSSLITRLVSTIAGNTLSSGTRNGGGTSATFSFSTLGTDRPGAGGGLSVGPTGDIFIVDGMTHAIRRLTPSGNVSTWVGNSDVAGSTDALIGTSARFSSPTGILASEINSEVFVCDTGNHIIRAVSEAGAVSTLAGGAGSEGMVNGQGQSARFSSPWAITLRPASALWGESLLFIADAANSAVRTVTLTGIVDCVAGAICRNVCCSCDICAEYVIPGMTDSQCDTGLCCTSSDCTEGLGTQYFGDGDFLKFPRAIAVSPNGVIYVGDSGNNRIIALSPKGNGELDFFVVAGSPQIPPDSNIVSNWQHKDGSALQTTFGEQICGLTVDARGRVYASDGWAIRRLTIYHTSGRLDMSTTATVTSLGSNTAKGTIGGSGTSARFTAPCALAFDSSYSRLYISDATRIRIATDDRAAAGARVSSLQTRALLPSETLAFSSSPYISATPFGLFLIDYNEGTIRAQSLGLSPSSMSHALLGRLVLSTDSLTSDFSAPSGGSAIATVSLTTGTILVGSASMSPPNPDETIAYAIYNFSAIGTTGDTAAVVFNATQNFPFTSNTGGASTGGVTGLAFGETSGTVFALITESPTFSNECVLQNILLGVASPNQNVNWEFPLDCTLRSVDDATLILATYLLSGIAVWESESDGGFVYVLKSNGITGGVILSMSLAQTAVTILAGSLLEGYSDLAIDDVGINARFSVPNAIAIDYGSGVLYVSDSVGFYVRRVILTSTTNAQRGTVETIIGNGQGNQINAIGNLASVGYIKSLTVDDDGDVIFADSLYNTLRYLTDIPCPIGSYCTGTDLVQPCPAGVYGATVGLSTAACSGVCHQGYFCPEGSTSATPVICPIGSYCPTGSAIPILCSSGTYSPSVGRYRTCALCPLGTFEDTHGAGVCTGLCDVGKYGIALGAATMSAACASCPVGSFAPFPGTITCTACAIGSYNGLLGSSSVSACLPCAKGSASAFTGQGSCAICPVGTFSSLTGLTSCTSCPAGTYSNKTALTSELACVKCDAGTYSSLPAQTEKASCVVCPPGTFSGTSGSARCTLCPAGFYNDFQGAASFAACLPCRAGTYNKFAGQAELGCQLCDDGYSSQSLNATSIDTCLACRAGSFSVSDVKYTCRLCDPGTWQSLSGQAACKPCEKGTYSASTGLNASSQCTLCPPGFTTNSNGATSINDCVDVPFTCAPGTEKPGKVRIFQQSSCVRLLCTGSLEYENIEESLSTLCLGCPFGQYGDVLACTTCPVSAICPGLTKLPLWNFSQPAGIYSFGGVTAAISGGGDALSVALSESPSATPLPLQGRRFRRAASNNANPLVLETPWDFCAPLTVYVPPVAAGVVGLTLWYMWAYILIGLIFFSFFISAFASQWWVFATIGKLTDFLSIPYVEIGKRERFFGAFSSLSAFSAVLFFSGVLISSYIYENAATNVSLLPLDNVFFRSSDPFMASAVPVSGDSVRGLQVRLTVSGDSCAILSRSDAPSPGMMWRYSPIKCTSTGTVYQHQWSCTDCIMPPTFIFSVDLHPSCQSLLLELGTTDAFGALTVLSTGSIKGDETGYLDTVSVTAVALFTFLNDEIVATNSRRGYTLQMNTPVITRNVATKSFVDVKTSSLVGALSPSSAFVSLVITFNIQQIYVVKTITAKLQSQDLIAQIFGLTSITGIVFTAFNCVRANILGERGGKGLGGGGGGRGEGGENNKENVNDDGQSSKRNPLNDDGNSDSPSSTSARDAYMMRRKSMSSSGGSPPDGGRGEDEPTSVELLRRRGSPKEFHIRNGKSPPGHHYSARVHPTSTALSPSHFMPTVSDYFNDLSDKNTHKVGGASLTVIPIPRQLKLALTSPVTVITDDEIDRLRRNY